MRSPNGPIVCSVFAPSAASLSTSTTGADAFPNRPANISAPAGVPPDLHAAMKKIAVEGTSAEDLSRPMARYETGPAHVMNALGYSE